MISPNRAIRGGSLSFSAIKPININEGLTPRYIKLSYTKQVLHILSNLSKAQSILYALDLSYLLGNLCQ